MAKGIKTGGRKKGTPNKKTCLIADKLKDMDCDPIEGMAIIAKESMAIKDYNIALSAYKELAQYIAPKRKSIEVSTDSDDEKIIREIEVRYVKADNSNG